MTENDQALALLSQIRDGYAKIIRKTMQDCPSDGAPDSVRSEVVRTYCKVLHEIRNIKATIREETLSEGPETGDVAPSEALPVRHEASAVLFTRGDTSDSAPCANCAACNFPKGTQVAVNEDCITVYTPGNPGADMLCHLTRADSLDFHTFIAVRDRIMDTIVGMVLDSVISEENASEVS